MSRHSLLNAAALNLQFSMNQACCDIGYSMLQHSPFCQFSGFFLFLNAAALKLLPISVFLPMLQHLSLFFFFVPFASFLSSFDSNARTITYNIKYHVNVSKMIIILIKLLSIRALKHINFTRINDF